MGSFFCPLPFHHLQVLPRPLIAPQPEVPG